MSNDLSYLGPDEEIVDPDKEWTELQKLEEQTEEEIFEDDDFIGPAEEEE